MADEKHRSPTPTGDEAEESDSVGPIEPGLKQITEDIVDKAANQRQRPAFDLIVSGFIGGLDVCFAPLGFAFATTHVLSLVGTEAAPFIGAMLYPIGFIFVILGRSQLFTESTLVPVVAVLSRLSNLRLLARQWAFVLMANLLGTLVFSFLFSRSGPLADKYGPALITAGEELLAFDFWPAVFSGILAGWVMALLTWLLATADSTLSRIVFIWLATFLIAAAPLHHSISGSAEVLFGVFLGDFTFADWLLRFQIPVTLGNAIGGTVLVGGLKWLQVQAGSHRTVFDRILEE